MDSDIESVADAFIERFQSITGSLSLPFSVSRNDIVSVLRLHSSVDDRVKGLLSLPQLRLIGGPQILTKLRQALVGGERVVQDFRGSAERMVATGGVAFFVIDSKPRVVQAWIVLCFLLFVYVFLFSQLLIQVGVPSESIKQFLRRGRPVPSVYVVPPSPSFGDLEFPLFWNYFMLNASHSKQNRVVVIGHKEQLDKVKVSKRKPTLLFKRNCPSDCFPRVHVWP